MLVAKETIYRCDICGKESKWIKGQWIAVIYSMKGGYDGWEHEFHVCGNACDNGLSELGKKLRLKLANEILNYGR